MELLVKNITLKYDRKPAADHISFSLQPGIHALMGENGAGKSTLLRVLSGVLKPDEGTVTLRRRYRAPAGKEGPVRDYDVSREEYRHFLGYLPQEVGFYPEFTGKDFLLYLSSLKGLTKKEAEQRTDRLLKLFSLEQEADKKVRSYSDGMRKRLGIAQALLNDPGLLLLDEPLSGLDPLEQLHFLELMRKMGGQRIILLTLHSAAVAADTADSILFLKNGRLVFRGRTDSLTEDLESLFVRYMRSPGPDREGRPDQGFTSPES